MSRGKRGSVKDDMRGCVRGSLQRYISESTRGYVKKEV